MDSHVAPVAEHTAMESRLYVAFELSASQWKLAMSPGLGARARRVSLKAGDLGALSDAIRRGKERFGLPMSVPVFSCYEAGRDGFWLHRYLEASGITNVVIDPASPKVDRRKRRRKTDRLDAEMLLSHLIHYWAGDRTVWRVVRVPGREAEDLRQLPRHLGTLKRDRQAIQSRIASLLISQGIQLRVGVRFLGQLESVRLWDGSALGPQLRLRLEVEYRRWQELSSQIREVQRQRAELVAESASETARKARDLARLKGLGPELSYALSAECFAGRSFRNGKQVGAFAGLSPTPYQSGSTDREQGIGKDGNGRIRWRAVELSWLWLRWQPHSALSQWFESRYAQAGARARRIGIVALARKLVVALWRYLEYGIVPEGAILKAA